MREAHDKTDAKQLLDDKTDVKDRWKQTDVKDRWRLGGGGRRGPQERLLLCDPDRSNDVKKNEKLTFEGQDNGDKNGVRYGYSLGKHRQHKLIHELNDRKWTSELIN